MAVKIKKVKLLNNMSLMVVGQDILQLKGINDAALSFPNILSLLRLLLTPLIIALLLNENMLPAFYCFVFASITDFIDGWYAKTFNAQTRLGAFLDPVADKVLIISIYLWLGISNLVPDWLSVLIISRDFFILVGLLMTLIAFDKIWIAPLGVGKTATFTQLSLAGMILFKEAYPSLIAQKLDILIEVSIYIVPFFSFISVFAYVLQWLVRITTPAVKQKEEEK